MKNITRLGSLFWIFYKNGLFYLSKQAFRASKLKYFIIWLPLFWPKKTNTSRGANIRQALEEAGPIFVKLGQQLSTRLDLLPEDIGQELTHLQDNVPPFPTEQAIKIIEDKYQLPLTKIANHFSNKPLASASIAQVHSAELLTKESVVFKLLRPGIKKIIHRDLNLMVTGAKILLFIWPQFNQFRPLDFIKEFKKTLINELDLRKEAANASQLKRNFANNSQLYIPTVHWELCKDNILVMERIHGIKSNNITALKQANVNLKELAETGINLLFTQVFRDAFFHADMHAGNIFINPTHPESPTYIAVDFGIIGTLSPSDQYYIAFNLWAFFKRDYKKIAELHVESGWLPPNTKIIEFEIAIRSVCEPIFEKPLKDISFGLLLMQLLHTAREFDMRIQPQLILLQKTLLNVEGMARHMYPDLNLWETASPFLNRWVNDTLGLKTVFREIKKQIPVWNTKLPLLPDIIFNHLQILPEMAQQHAKQQQALQTTQNKIFQLQKKLPFKILSIMLGFSAITTMLLLTKQQQIWLHVPIQSWILFIAAVLFWFK